MLWWRVFTMRVRYIIRWILSVASIQYHNLLTIDNVISTSLGFGWYRFSLVNNWWYSIWPQTRLNVRGVMVTSLNSAFILMADQVRPFNIAIINPNSTRRHHLHFFTCAKWNLYVYFCFITLSNATVYKVVNEAQFCFTLWRIRSLFPLTGIITL